jgi:hypothetical protein
MSSVAQQAEIPLGRLKAFGYQRLSTGRGLVR